MPGLPSVPDVQQEPMSPLPEKRPYTYSIRVGYGFHLRSIYEVEKKERRLGMDNSVKIYSLSTCSHCRATKTFLDECQVKYDFTDVDLLEGDERTAIIEDVKKLNPNCSFPTIIIGDKVIVGYKEDEIKEALGL
jgi:glutaredoxin